MFENPLSGTAIMTAVARASESQRPSATVVDPYAEKLAGSGSAEEYRTIPDAENLTAAIATRTRLFDAAIRRAIDEGATQVLLPAAGLDARAWRMNLPSHVAWFEADHAPVLEHKARTLAGEPPTVTRTAVPVDLRTRELPKALDAAGFDRTRRTAIFIEGLLMYMSRTEVESLLEMLAGLAPRGSLLVVDVYNRACVDPDGALKDLLAALAARNARWQFGTDDPRGLFAAAGWILDDLTFAGLPHTAGGAAPCPVIERPPPGVPITWLARSVRAA